MTLEPNSKIYFIGIGGIAMSAAAGIAKQLGFVVSGSDSKAIYNPSKAVLDESGINYQIGYDVANLPELASTTFIASAGEDETNPEIAALRSKDIQIYSLAELLQELFKDKLRVVVTGTHGKSTTTAMLGQALAAIDRSSFMTGAIVVDLNRNFQLGEGHYAVFEGDEYKALYDDPTPKFMQYQADILLLTNLEFDHPDLFASLEELRNEFLELIHKMPDDGLIVYNADDIEVSKLSHSTNIATVGFALNNRADFVGANINTHEDYTEFTVQKTGDFPAETYRIHSFGRLNVYNALGPIALLRTLGFSPEQVQDGLDQFKGLKRRFELIGEVRGAKVFDDYAHHPTAIKETLAMARLRFPESRIWVVFEPHTFSRTEALLTELAIAFADADQVLISEIYPAREQQTTHTITGAKLVEAVGTNHDQVRLVAHKGEAKTILDDELKPEDVVIIMAVGDFNTLASELVNQHAV